MKTEILKLFIFVFLFTIVEAVDPKWEKVTAERFNDLRKQKENTFKECCSQKGIPNECSQFCTYDFKKFSDPMKLLKTLNPGWFLVHHFLPGKCYLSEMDHFIPCSIENQDVTQCCRNISKIHQLIESFPQLKEYKDYLPKQSDILSDPEWCQEICSGKTFEITPKRFFSCSSTIKAALACYWHRNADIVSKNITGISTENLKNIYEYVHDHGYPNTVTGAEEMLNHLDPEVVAAIKEKPELLIEGLKQAGASQEQIDKVQTLIQRQLGQRTNNPHV